MNWVWIESLGHYRDLDTGQFVSRAEIRALSRELAQGSAVTTDSYADMLATDLLDVSDWELLMRQEIKDEYVAQYTLARGGWDQMTPADWGSIGGMLREQYQYLNGFAAEIAAGNLTEAQIAARSRLYIRSASEARERALARVDGVPTDRLPAIPGDGSTTCLVNCGCHWEHDPVLDNSGALIGWNSTWVLNPELENCMAERGRDGCIERSIRWDPLFIPID